MRHEILRTAAITVAALAAAPATLGQMADVEPYQARVVDPQAEIRSGWGSDAWYSVGQVPEGTTLTVDARDGDWLQVRYPDGHGFGVLLRARDVEINEDAGVARVTRPARAIHRNRQSPIEGSWLKMTGEPFPPGTEFDVIEVLQSEGEPFFVLVEPHDDARGYVSASAVERVRTETTATQPQTPEQSPSDPDGAETAPSSAAPDPESEPEGESTPAAETDAADTDAPSDEAPTPPDNDQTPADDDDAGSDPDGEVERGVATADQLARAYAAVIAEPVEDAELTPLIEEFARAIEVEESERVRSRLEAQRELLEIRRDLQRDLRAVTSAADRADQERRAVERLVGDWRSRPTYTVVGRLMASSLYDGRRLPLMYRLQSLDGPGGRTIAYILPDDELDLNAKVGAVVGVLGDTRRDRTIRVRLIDPEQVDVLEPGGG